METVEMKNKPIKNIIVKIAKNADTVERERATLYLTWKLSKKTYTTYNLLKIVLNKIRTILMYQEIRDNYARYFLIS